MRIHNLKALPETVTPPAIEAANATPAVSALDDAGDDAGADAGGGITVAPVTVVRPAGAIVGPTAHQATEIAFLKARIQHLELVVETARSLMGSNHERLLRRLHEVPRELVELSNQLRRVDPHTIW